MKSLFKSKGGLLGLIAFVLASALCIPSLATEGMNYLAQVGLENCTMDTLTGGVASAKTVLGGGVSMASMFLVFKGKDDTEEKFEVLDAEAIGKLEPDAQKTYFENYIESQSKAINYMTEKFEKAKDSDKVKIEKQIAELVKENNTNMREQYKAQSLAMTKLLEEIETAAKEKEGNFEDNLKTEFDKHSEDFNAAKETNANLGELKSRYQMILTKAAVQTYGDLTRGEDYAQMREGVINKPVRKPRIRSLFGTIPLSTEFYKYPEQDTVVRDAKNVAKCAAVDTNTKETLIVRTLETKVVKDVITFCRTFVSDYPFMQSRITKLLNESVSLREDDQLLTGDNTGENTKSIDFYASEFSAANVEFPIDGTIQDATMVDLAIGMKRQIETLGQLNEFNPNVMLVNTRDWFINVESRKDTQGRYIDSRVTYVNGQPYLDGMLVVPLMNVAINKMYVLDSTKAEVLDRMTYEVEVSFENKDNWEKELADIKGKVRVNLWCPNEWINSMMKCSDITAAITAIDDV